MFISEKALAPHSSTLAWKIPWTEEPGRLQSMGPLRLGHDWATSLSLFTFMHWRRKWQPTPVFLPGESQGQGSLVGCRLRGRTESDTTEVTQQQQHVHLVATPWTAASQASLSFTISSSLRKLMSIESVMPFKHLILSSPSSPAFNLSNSNIRVKIDIWRKLQDKGKGNGSKQK